MSADSDRALAVLRRHGHHSTSFQILEDGLRYWFGDDAVVAYLQVGRRRVVAGPPVCAPDQKGAVARAFLEDCGAARHRALFFCTDPDFAQVLARAGAPASWVQIGEQPEWVPAGYTLAGSVRRSLRAQVNRARNKGVEVGRVTPADLQGPVRGEIDAVLRRWLDARRMSVMRFMVDLQPFAHADERRYYLARHAGRAVGFLAAVPVYRRRGWFLEDVLRVPDAPNGTAEMLIERALADAHAAGDEFVTLGLAPLSGVDTAPGPHLWLRRCFRFSWEHLRPLYDFSGIRNFKARFRPDRWTAQYLVVSPPGIGFWDMHAVLRAFAGRGLAGFALDTAARWIRRGGIPVWVVGGLLVLATVLVWLVAVRG